MFTLMFNPFTPKIKKSILHTMCHRFPLISVLRIYCSIRQHPLVDIITHGLCKALEQIIWGFNFQILKCGFGSLREGCFLLLMAEQLTIG